MSREEVDLEFYCVDVLCVEMLVMRGQRDEMVGQQVGLAC